MTGRPFLLLAIAGTIAGFAILMRPTPFVQLDLHTAVPVTEILERMHSLPQGLILVHPAPTHVRVRALGNDQAQGQLAIAAVQQQLQRQGVSPRVVVTSAGSGALENLIARALGVGFAVLLLCASAREMLRLHRLSPGTGVNAVRRASI
ncbi:MAG: hypothetical protein AAGF45_07800 [Pseudomonadota bacterium]